MIKTEAKRIVIISCEQRVPPSEVLEAMRKYDSALELIWNNDDNQWEIYRIKHKGITLSEDVLCWQMSAPEKGTGITPSIINWLRQFDSSPNGIFSIEELQKKWCDKMKTIVTDDNLRLQKKMDEIQYGYQPFIRDVAVDKTVVVVPRTVGYNKRTGKRIYAVPRKKRVLNGK